MHTINDNIEGATQLSILFSCSFMAVVIQLCDKAVFQLCSQASNQSRSISAAAPDGEGLAEELVDAAGGGWAEELVDAAGGGWADDP